MNDDNWIKKITTTTTTKLTIFIVIFYCIVSLFGESITVNCAEIQIEDYCDGPICEYLLWKPDQDEINIEKKFPKKLLYFRNSIIPKIPIEIFNVYPDIKQLSMSNVNVEELPENMISDSLEFLYLSNNKIKMIENDAFKSLPNLKYLWLSDNQIENLGSFAFDSMDNLLFLEISGNNMTELPDTLFKNAPKLTSLFLSNNNLEKLQIGLFDSNPNLYQLNVDNNNIITIDDNIFRRVKILNIFDISFNPIKTLNLININIEKLISNSSNLIKLSIGGVIKQIEFSKTPIKKIQLTEPENLESLVLTDCFLRDLSIIESFSKLRFLNVSSNPLTKFDSESLKSLKYLEVLSIENCDINQLEVGVFATVKDLKYLDISNNKLQEINLDTLRHVRYLKNISIYGNQWSCCSLKPLIRWLRLRSISFMEESEINQSRGVYLNGINCIV